MPEQREKRYQVCCFENGFKVKVVSSWDSYSIADQEANRLTTETRNSHWVKDRQVAGEIATVLKD